MGNRLETLVWRGFPVGCRSFLRSRKRIPARFAAATASRFRVDRAIYSGPDIFESEIEFFSEGGWVFLAHESQMRIGISTHLFSDPRCLAKIPRAQ